MGATPFYCSISLLSCNACPRLRSSARRWAQQWSLQSRVVPVVRAVVLWLRGAPSCGEAHQAKTYKAHFLTRGQRRSWRRSSGMLLGRFCWWRASGVKRRWGTPALCSQNYALRALSLAKVAAPKTFNNAKCLWVLGSRWSALSGLCRGCVQCGAPGRHKPPAVVREVVSAMVAVTCFTFSAGWRVNAGKGGAVMINRVLWQALLANWPWLRASLEASRRNDGKPGRFLIGCAVVLPICLAILALTSLTFAAWPLLLSVFAAWPLVGRWWCGGALTILIWTKARRDREIPAWRRHCAQSFIFVGCGSRPGGSHKSPPGAEIAASILPTVAAGTHGKGQVSVRAADRGFQTERCSMRGGAWRPKTRFSR